MTSLGRNLFFLLTLFMSSSHALPPECERQYVFGDMRCQWWLGRSREAWVYDKSARICRQVPFHTCPKYENRMTEVTFISRSRCQKKCIRCDTKVIYADMRCESFEGDFKRIWFYDNRINECRTTIFYTCSRYQHRVADVAFVRRTDCESFCQRGSFIPMVNKEPYGVRIHIYITMLQIILETTDVTSSTTKQTGSQLLPLSHRDSFPQTTKAPVQCQSLSFIPCRSLGYTETFQPNLFGDENQSAAQHRFQTFVEPLLDRGCSKSLMEFYCSLIFPKCTHGVPKYPCKSVCLDVRKGCGETITDGFCDHLVDDEQLCFRPRNRWT